MQSLQQITIALYQPIMTSKDFLQRVAWPGDQPYSINEGETIGADAAIWPSRVGEGDVAKPRYDEDYIANISVAQTA